MPRLKEKFEDKKYPGFTNYEHVVRSVSNVYLYYVYDNDLLMINNRFLEERRLEGQKEGEENIPEVKRAVKVSKAVVPNSNTEANTIRKISSYSPPKRMLQRSRYNQKLCKHLF